MKNRSACLFCLMFCFAAPLTGYAEDQAIKDLIHKLVAFQKGVRMHGSDYIANAERSTQFSTDEFTNTMNDALKKHDLDKLGGLAMVSHSENLHDFEMEKNGNLVIVTFLEDYEEVFYRTQGYTYTKDGITHEVPTGYENTTKGVSRPNKVTLREEDSRWVIIEHKIYEISIPKMDKSKLDVDAFHTLFSRSEDRKKFTCPKITGTLSRYPTIPKRLANGARDSGLSENTLTDLHPSSLIPQRHRENERGVVMLRSGASKLAL